MLSGFVGVKIGRANRMEGGWSFTLSLIPFKGRDCHCAAVPFHAKTDRPNCRRTAIESPNRVEMTVLASLQLVYQMASLSSAARSQNAAVTQPENPNRVLTNGQIVTPSAQSSAAAMQTTCSLRSRPWPTPILRNNSPRDAAGLA